MAGRAELKSPNVTNQATGDAVTEVALTFDATIPGLWTGRAAGSAIMKFTIPVPQKARKGLYILAAQNVPSTGSTVRAL